MPAIVVATQAEQASHFYVWAGRFVAPEDKISAQVFCAFDAEHQGVVAEKTIHDKEPSQRLLKLCQERGVDTLILQVDASSGASVKSLRLAEALIAAKKVSVLCLDIGSAADLHCDNILVPIDSPKAWAGMDLALSAVGHRGTVKPLLLASTQNSSQPLTERRKNQLMRKWLIESTRRVTPESECIDQPDQRLREHANNSDLIVLSDSGTDRLIGMRRGNTDKKLLPVSKQKPIAWIAPIGRNTRYQAATLISYALRWVPMMDRDERVNLTAKLQEGATWNADFVVMMGLSTAIAAMGLMQNSAAVVIGAMLVAPLMTPLIAAGWAMTQGNIQMFKTAIKTMALGVVAGLCLAMLLGLLSPRSELTQQIISRGTPDILDLGVAAVSGIAAAYAMSRASVSAALPGVAIAAALVPPLSCVGISLAFSRMNIALGAAMLLVANLATIIIASALTFRVLGVRLVRRQANPVLWTRRVAMIVTIFILTLTVPLWQSTQKINAQGQSRELLNPVSPRMRAAIIDYLAHYPNITPILIGRPATTTGREIDVGITMASTEPVPPQIYWDLKKIASDVLNREAHIYVVPMKDAWAEPPMTWIKQLEDTMAPDRYEEIQEEAAHPSPVENDPARTQAE